MSVTILDTIVTRTREDVVKRSFKYSKTDFQSFPFYTKPRLSLKKALLANDDISIIAEIKKASPTKGLIRADFDPIRFAADYQSNGAAAVSVLTDKPFFRGDLSYMEVVAQQVIIPVLRKDFIVTSYQLHEAKAYGADAVLLIVSILERSELYDLISEAKTVGLEVLTECYSQEEVESLDFEYVDILGVNNRDLKTFEVNLHRGIELLKIAPEKVVTVSESGLSSQEDMALLRKNRIHAALIGEYFMRQPLPGEALKQLINLKEQI